MNDDTEIMECPRSPTDDTEWCPWCGEVVSTRVGYTLGEDVAEYYCSYSHAEKALEKQRKEGAA